MIDTTSFLSAELTEIGLLAAADPHFAERLLAALRGPSAERASKAMDARATASECHKELCA